MKYNYPIKYALIPMGDEKGWDVGLHRPGRVYETAYYIASKCYLVGETKKYMENGNVNTTYNIVFPYYLNRYINGWFRERPQHDNSICVDNVFDTYEEALKAKDEYNKKLLNKELSVLSISNLEEKEKSIRSKYKRLSEYYDTFEKDIEACTNDLILDNRYKEQSIIIRTNLGFGKFNHSLYNHINIFSDENFIVYSLTKEEYDELNKVVDTENVNFDKYNYNPLLINDSTSKTIKVMLPNNEEEFIYNNEYISKNVKSFNMPQKFDRIIYTIEDYNDILHSYMNYDMPLKLTKK